MTRAGRQWWKHGVLYQVYPRSFADHDGDGVGDLEGLRRKLDHLVWLGVEGVWISPCFTSPMADFGYDVADYCDIDPVFGALEDMDRLLEDAHARGLKVMLDWVPNHSSDQHAWFMDSRSSKTSAKRDWYFWRDPAPGGGPPNNWVSVFGGSAWEFDEASGQFYLHSYLKEQPDLNWRNPEVEAAMHGVLRFWLDRGVDGFRIDVIHRIGKHPTLADNPPLRGPPPFSVSPEWDRQDHAHDEDDPVVHVFLKRIRALVDAYEERALVGEVWVFDPDTAAAYYGDGDELHLAFNFSFLDTPWEASAFEAEVRRADDVIPSSGWPTWVLSNHDLPRAATRYAPRGDDERLKVAAAMTLTLRGTPWVYYGEEIGMRDVAVPKERWQDPVSHSLGAAANRDPCRTPMQWTAGQGAGFTSANDAWLPIGDASLRNVEALAADESSLLSTFRQWIAFRRDHAVLEEGSLDDVRTEGTVLRYDRHLDGIRAAVFLNFGDQPAEIHIPEGTHLATLSTRHGTAALQAAVNTLQGDEALVVVLGPEGP